MNGDFQKNNWNEFDWEKELRKDDERVNTYMGELPRYIDLPDEDAVIMKQIQRRPELVPHSGVWPSTPMQDSDSEDEEDDISWRSEDWQKQEGADIHILAGKLSRKFSLLYSDSASRDAGKMYLQALCVLGKIMARSDDIIDMPTNEFRTLRITLGKRILSDVNYLMGVTMNIAKLETERTAVFNSLLEELQILRERAIAMIKRARNPKNPETGSQNP